MGFITSKVPHTEKKKSLKGHKARFVTDQDNSNIGRNEDQKLVEISLPGTLTEALTWRKRIKSDWLGQLPLVTVFSKYPLVSCGPKGGYPNLFLQAASSTLPPNKLRRSSSKRSSTPRFHRSIYVSLVLTSCSITYFFIRWSYKTSTFSLGVDLIFSKWSAD